MSARWFKAIGPKLLSSSILLAVFPIIDFVIGVIVRKLGNHEFKTLRQFMMIHEAPRFNLHLRYSFICVQVYMMFTYGLFIPFIVPITLLGIFINYVMDKLQLAYHYSQPPRVSHTLQSEVY